jgi:DNA-binding SARP family transcriptional activator/tetratricopeptide (TPR) repeat protein
VSAQTEYRLLGPLAVVRRGVGVPVPPGKQRVLLAALLLRAGRLVGVDELAETLWGSGIPVSAVASLHNYVARLRRALGPAAGDGGGPVIRTEPGGYLIRIGADELDVTRFEAALAAGRAAARAGSWPAAAQVLRSGLALWRGEPLAGLESDVLAAREVPRLTELRLQATEARAEADLHLGRSAELVVELRGLASAQPLRERLHALLMTALYLQGRQGEALAAYQAARDALVAELGAEPGAELRRLQEQILAGAEVIAAGPARAAPGPAEPMTAGPGPAEPVAAGAGAAPAAGRGAVELRYSLPADTAAFTGRDGELASILAPAAGGAAAIRAIGGMPGIGKTTLAVHAAHLLRDQYPDRQLFIDLRAHTPGQDPVAPAAALAGLLAAVGVDLRSLPEDLPSRAALWRDRMAGQRAVLVLDNAASSAQVVPLLPGGGDCLVLVTSRRHLADLPGVVIGVALPALPAGQAAAMFSRLAPRAAAGPDRAVAGLAELAGYLPLAISLLARVYNRHPAWTLADLAAETRASLLTLAAESDSVAAAFEVSWRHLEPAQQEFFRALGLHPSTAVDPYAAAALAGVPVAAAAAHLDALHGEGLLTETGYRRYGMHDLIRRYAADRAAAGLAPDRDQALGRLLDYYQHTAALAAARLPRPSPAPPVALPPAQVPDLPDSDTALAWSRAERVALRDCLDYAARAGDRPRLIALTAAVAELLRQDGRWAEGIRRHGAAAAAARAEGDRAGLAGALSDLGLAQDFTGQHGEAFEALAEALDLYRAVGDQRGQAMVLQYQGEVSQQVGDYQAAAAQVGDSLAIFRALGDAGAQARCLLYQGLVRRSVGDHAGAAAALAESLARYRDLGNLVGQANVLGEIGRLRRQAGDYPGAVPVLAEALEIYRGLGNRTGQANALTYQGTVLAGLGDFPAAGRALAEGLALYRETGDRDGEAEALNSRGALDLLAGRPGPAAAWYREALGVARDLGSAWDEATALAGLGRCAAAAGDAAGATRSLGQAHEIFARIGAAETAGVAAELAGRAGR